MLLESESEPNTWNPNPPALVNNEAEAEAKSRSQSRSQATKNLGSRSLGPKKAGFSPCLVWKWTTCSLNYLAISPVAISPAWVPKRDLNLKEPLRYCNTLWGPFFFLTLDLNAGHFQNMSDLSGETDFFRTSWNTNTKSQNIPILPASEAFLTFASKSSIGPCNEANRPYTSVENL